MVNTWEVETACLTVHMTEYVKSSNLQFWKFTVRKEGKRNEIPEIQTRVTADNQKYEIWRTFIRSKCVSRMKPE